MKLGKMGIVLKDNTSQFFLSIIIFCNINGIRYPVEHGNPAVIP